MKYIIATAFLLSLGINLNAQNNNIDVLLPNGNQIHTNQFTDYVQQADAYWEVTPHDFKGSGIKPYMRWKELWKNRVKPNGTLQTAEEIAQSWNNVMQLRNEVLNDNSQWVPLGPFTHVNQGSWSSGQGRVNITTVDPNNANTFYIGTPDGGIWKTSDNGSSWTSIGDDIPVLGISGIAVDYNNSDIIYISTGDEDGNDTSSNGVYKTINGGTTWTQTGSISASRTGEILINPNNSNMLWVVSNGGLLKSTDAGATWTQTQSGNIREIRLKPTDPNTVYIVRQITTQGSESSSILKSTNAGDTFTSVKDFTGAGRTMIDVTPANANYLYALVANSDNSFNSIWRTTDSGATFSERNNSTDVLQSTQAYYDLALAASDTDAETIYTGCLNVFKSTNGGTTMVQQNNWNSPNSIKYTHADIHDIKFYNGNIYVGSDGGIYTSTDNGVTFQDKTKNGLNISQFYRIDVAQENATKVVGGLQDNGGFAYNNNTWINYHGADGMDAAIDPTNTDLYFGFIQYGGSLYTVDVSNSSNSGSGVASSPFGEYGEWVTPLEMGNSGTLYSGFSKLYSMAAGGWMQASSYDFVTNLEIIRVAPNNDNKVLAFNGNKLYVSDGTSAMNFSELEDPFQFGTINRTGWNNSVKCFDFNRNDSNIIYVANSANIYKSEDAGATWTNITGSIPTSDAKVGIIHQASSVNNTIYLATENAVYYRNDTSTDWQIFSTGLSHSTITDIEINNVENHVIISTYGRGVWRSPVDSESLAVDDISTPNSELVVYPNPVVDYVKVNVEVNEDAQVDVYNLSGAQIINKKYKNLNQDTQIDLSTLTKGIYIIKITTPTHLITKKIIKK